MLILNQTDQIYLYSQHLAWPLLDIQSILELKPHTIWHFLLLKWEDYEDLTQRERNVT